jgi:Flp pilus assembly protein TadB
MAQTKRKRQTKHRGNAAGVVEARGRTGRPPSAEEKKKADRNKRRDDRLNRKPTWIGSAQRALLAGVLMFVFALFLDKPRHGGSPLAAALVIALFAMVLYLVLGYWLETMLWRRRMAKKQATTAK